MKDNDTRLEIVEVCVRPTKYDQLWRAYAWEAYLPYPGRVGPVVESYSRKNVRTKARTAFNAQYTEQTTT